MSDVLAGVPVINTARLRLRPVLRDDVDDLFALHADPRAMRYWSFAPWTVREQAQAWFDARQADGRTREHHPWGVERREAEGLIGLFTVFALDRMQRRCEVGYLLRPDHWGCGYATEALRAVLAHAFDVFGMARVEADVDPRNTASCRLVERAGFRREGLLRERWRVNGEVCDSAIYGLLRREFAG